MNQTTPKLAKDRYELISALGKGGMALVFKALDTRLKVEKAIKIPNHTCLINPRIRKRFETEATTMAKLHHKNIVVIHDIVEELYSDPNNLVAINLVYMVMEIMPGGSLQERIDKHGRLHPQQAIEATIAMLSGLGFAHKHNVVHRDVKLDNMLIGLENELKLTDFGIAQDDGGSGMTQTGATMGTLAFMAPEQKLSSRRATFLSDLYSAGAFFYVTMTGKNPSELYAIDIQERAFDALSDEVATFLAKACHMDPDQRFQSAAEMIEALNDLRLSFEALPKDAKPFYMPRPNIKLTDDELLHQIDKVNTLWTTLIGESEYSTGVSHRENPSSSLNTLNVDVTAERHGINDPFSSNHTLTDELGLDLINEVFLEDDKVENPEISQEVRENSIEVRPQPVAEGHSSMDKTNIVIVVMAILLVGLVIERIVSRLVPEQESAGEHETRVEPVVEVTPKQEEVQSISSTEDKQTEEDIQHAEKQVPQKKTTIEVSNKRKNRVETGKATRKTSKSNAKGNGSAVVPVSDEKKERRSTTVKPVITTQPEQPEKPIVMGEIALRSNPWSMVTIDGKAAICKGKSDNATTCKTKLPVGQHKVQFQSNEGNLVRERMITIKEGKNHTICWNLEFDSACK